MSRSSSPLAFPRALALAWLLGSVSCSTPGDEGAESELSERVEHQVRRTHAPSATTAKQAESRVEQFDPVQVEQWLQPLRLTSASGKTVIARHRRAIMAVARAWGDHAIDLDERSGMVTKRTDVLRHLYADVPGFVSADDEDRRVYDHALGLVAENSGTHANDGDIDATLDPCDKPDPGFVVMQNCSPGEISRLGPAFEHGHYQNWRALQLLDHILELNETDPEAAEDAWAQQSLDEMVSLETWFGPFSEARAEAVRSSFQFIFDNRFAAAGVATVACYDDPDFIDVFFPQLLLAKLASPCLWSDAVMHTEYVLFPNLHPDYEFPTIEACDPFFDDEAHDPIDRGSIMLHEFLHWTSNAFGLLRDSFSGCNEGFGLLCNEPGESMDLAASNPDSAVINIYSYNFFTENYARAYLERQCQASGALCFAPDPFHEECQGGGDGGDGGGPGIPQECDGTDPGTCVDGECAPRDLNTDELDPLGAWHPDGDFSVDLQCSFEDGGSGARLSCVDVGGAGRCQRCMVDTMIGCPCDTSAECQNLGEDLGCYGGPGEGNGANANEWPGSTGLCWDSQQPPPWQCAEGCSGRSDYLGGDQYYCIHTVEPGVGGSPFYPECVSIDCPEPDGTCFFAPDDTFCAPAGQDCNGEQCCVECEDDPHCSTAFGWPPNYDCTPQLRCAPS